MVFAEFDIRKADRRVKLSYIFTLLRVKNVYILLCCVFFLNMSEFLIHYFYEHNDVQDDNDHYFFPVLTIQALSLTTTE